MPLESVRYVNISLSNRYSMTHLQEESQQQHGTHQANVIP